MISLNPLQHPIFMCCIHDLCRLILRDCGKYVICPTKRKSLTIYTYIYICIPYNYICIYINTPRSLSLLGYCYLIFRHLRAHHWRLSESDEARTSLTHHHSQRPQALSGWVGNGKCRTSISSTLTLNGSIRYVNQRFNPRPQT